MTNDNEIRKQKLEKAIETLENQEQCTCNNPTITCKYCEAVTTVRNLVQRYLDAGEGVLPKEKVLDDIPYAGNESHRRVAMYNWNACRESMRIRLVKNMPTEDEIFNKLPKFWWKTAKKTIQIPRVIMLETAKSIHNLLINRIGAKP